MLIQSINHIDYFILVFFNLNTDISNKLGSSKLYENNFVHSET